MCSDKIIIYSTQEILAYDLSAEGAQLAEQGSHEARVWAALPFKGQGNGLSVKNLREAVGDESAKLGQGRAFKSGWIGKEGDNLVKLVRVLDYLRAPLEFPYTYLVRSDLDSQYC